MSNLILKSFVNSYSDSSIALVASPSKSQTLRAILFASLAVNEKPSIIRNYLVSPDCEAMITACRLLGATIQQYPDHLEIWGVHGSPQVPTNIVDAGNSGIVYRFIMAISALIDGYTVITGDESIRTRRPASALLSGLQQLGALCISTQGNDKAPIIIKGPISPGVATINGEDSQPVSALIISSIFLPDQTEINILNPGETPWVNVTLEWLNKFNIKYINNDFKKITIFNVNNNNRNLINNFDYYVPGDFSSILYPVAAAIITGVNLTIKNLDFTDSQGDKAVLDILISMGADICIDSDQKKLNVNSINKASKLKGRVIDVNNIIDSLPILAVIACYASSETQLINCEIARYKESDRLSAITQELSKMGASIIEQKDRLIIKPSVLHHAITDSHCDHRIAMSIAIAALGVKGVSKNNLTHTKINNTDCINKSYASFVDDLKKIVGQSILECCEEAHAFTS